MKNKILLIEDDPILGRSVKVALELAQFDVIWKDNVAEAKHVAHTHTFDLAILDVQLPDGNGFEICQFLKDKGIHCPIFFLTARIDEDSAVMALQMGATDYLRKPFGPRELVAKIVKTLANQPEQNLLRFDDLIVDLDLRCATIQGRELKLNRKEFDLLVIFIQNSKKVLTREQIIQNLSANQEIFDRTIDSHVSHLRTRLKTIPDHRISISSVYGVGYKLDVAP